MNWLIIRVWWIHSHFIDVRQVSATALHCPGSLCREGLMLTDSFGAYQTLGIKWKKKSRDSNTRCMLNGDTHKWHGAITSVWRGEGQAMVSLDHNRIEFQATHWRQRTGKEGLFLGSWVSTSKQFEGLCDIVNKKYKTF